MSKSLSVAALILLVAFTLAGCGVRNDPEPPTEGDKTWPGTYPKY
ncbi:MAG: hypothetical protein QM537_08455 [Candidatus Symbiobacter sp.]|nr:hypothetical protein [Candidatus Symbiobacter sp.]